MIPQHLSNKTDSKQKGVRRVEKVEELKVLCLPIVEWLEKNHDPHVEIRISAERIDLVGIVIGIPVGKE